ncbi:flagellar hook-basal body protein [Aneurinibacillus terranovensis]|uniref:flagellar hook-basal body protein n=1 Tax=Aneurinibacillus terranovensis TaxID=278991 RepID=UPI00040D8921|nr:flagellar hook-basal body protein [Aneurinibacillus terranovensis]
MNTPMINAASGMRALQIKMDTLANNIANVNTTGFKSHETNFTTLLTREIDNQPYPQYEQGRLTPNHIRPGVGVKETAQQIDFTQGTIKQTDVPTDLYLEGDAFFAIRQQGIPGRQAGATGPVLTRDGSFKLRPLAGNPARVELVTAQGDAVMGVNGQPIVLPAAATDLKVSDKGQFSYRIGAGARVPGPALALYSVQNPYRLQSLGDNLYTVPQAADASTTIPADVRVRQGGLEMSNVDLRKEMTTLIETQRALQFNARALSYSDQMAGVTNQIYKGG